MITSRQARRYARLLVVGLALMGLQPAHAAAPRVVVENASPDVAASTAAALQRHGEEAARRITEWLGGSATTQVRLVIDPTRRVPYTEDPAANGSVTIRLPAARLKPDDVAGSRLALFHELTHAIAPGAPGMDRLLVEGLAVMVEDQLGTPNYPDLEQTPDEVVIALEAKLGRTIPLAESERARLERPDGNERQLAYAQQGSFVAWLVSRYGLKSVLDVYRTGADYRRGFGKPLEALEGEWRQALARARAVRPTSE